jgi:hypothetical protein
MDTLEDFRERLALFKIPPTIICSAATQKLRIWIIESPASTYGKRRVELPLNLTNIEIYGHRLGTRTR